MKILKLISQCHSVFLNGLTRLQYNQVVAAKRLMWQMRAGKYQAVQADSVTNSNDGVISNDFVKPVYRFRSLLMVCSNWQVQSARLLMWNFRFGYAFSVRNQLLSSGGLNGYPVH